MKSHDIKDMNYSMHLSLLVGVLIFLMKGYAYYVTGSTAILSDVLESVIHLISVVFATYSMWLSLKPADDNHLYGHDKVGFFSAGFEGAMITFAALLIFYEAGKKLIYGVELNELGEGILFIALATLINLLLSLFLMAKGKKYRSIILEANGKHILTDVWTSIAVVVALLAVKYTGILWLDPVIAIFAASNIIWTGYRLISKSVRGLMDEADQTIDKQINNILDEETKKLHLDYHQLRNRMSGSKVFIELHLLFPEDLYLGKAHEIASQIEQKLKESLPNATEIYTHLELAKNHDETHQKYGLPA